MIRYGTKNKQYSTFALFLCTEHGLHRLYNSSFQPTNTDMCFQAYRCDGPIVLAPPAERTHGLTAAVAAGSRSSCRESLYCAGVHPKSANGTLRQRFPLISLAFSARSCSCGASLTTPLLRCSPALSFSCRRFVRPSVRLKRPPGKSHLKCPLKTEELNIIVIQLWLWSAACLRQS